MQVKGSTSVQESLKTPKQEKLPLHPQSKTIKIKRKTKAKAKAVQVYRILENAKAKN